MPINISIHALREEGDRSTTPFWASPMKFLSTPSARRATLVYGRQRRGKLISIHALREEGDDFVFGLLAAGDVISIHALREEGDEEDMEIIYCKLDFYPRPPRGGRRTATDEETFGYQISIHALREEGDRAALRIR